MKFGFGSGERRDQCGLCGKEKSQVRKLIVGLQGAVCSDCIDLCCDILCVPAPAASETREGAFTVEIPEPLARTFRNPFEVLQALTMLSSFADRKAVELQAPPIETP